MSDVTKILGQIQSGDPAASDQLLPIVYEELRKLAAAKLAQEKPGQTLQATALVHEGYMRLVGEDVRWDSRGHFFAAAAEAMRRILVDHARRKTSEKHGGGVTRVALEDNVAEAENSTFDLLAVNDALSQLEAEDPQMAKVVKLKFFAGLTLEETAKAIGRSRASTQRDWSYARAWLYGKLAED